VISFFIQIVMPDDLRLLAVNAHSGIPPMQVSILNKMTTIQIATLAGDSGIKPE